MKIRKQKRVNKNRNITLSTLKFINWLNIFIIMRSELRLIAKMTIKVCNKNFTDAFRVYLSSKKPKITRKVIGRKKLRYF